MANSADPDQFRSQLILIYPICKGRAYPGSVGLGLIQYDQITADSSEAENVRLSNDKCGSFNQNHIITLAINRNCRQL